ncbi:MAG: hypothetical protein K2O00_05295 [Muribaculaceae bacterium]|nr:hypothetical protein [Muribaculaceae bacterium]
MKKITIILLFLVLSEFNINSFNEIKFYKTLKEFYNIEFNLKLTESEISASDFTPVECFLDWKYFGKIPVYNNENEITDYMQNDSV